MENSLEVAVEIYDCLMVTDKSDWKGGYNLIEAARMYLNFVKCRRIKQSMIRL